MLSPISPVPYPGPLATTVTTFPELRPGDQLAGYEVEAVIGRGGMHAIGDDAWRQLRAWHDRTLRAVFAVHGGAEIDNAGDGFFVTFGASDGTVACASDIQRTFALHGLRHGFAPRLRIGIHAGRASRLGTSFTGQAVVTAARLGSVAGPGEILVSRSAADGVPGLAWLEERLVQLKGIVDPVSVVSVPWD